MSELEQARKRLESLIEAAFERHYAQAQFLGDNDNLRKRFFIALADAGFKKPREDRLHLMRLITGDRGLGTSNDLPADVARAIIEFVPAFSPDTSSAAQVFRGLLNGTLALWGVAAPMDGQPTLGELVAEGTVTQGVPENFRQGGDEPSTEQEAKMTEPQEEYKVEQQEERLFVKTTSVTYGRKFNLDNYESVTLDVTMWADRVEGGDLKTDFAALWETAKQQVKAAAMPLLKSRDGERQAIASNRPRTGPAPPNDVTLHGLPVASAKPAPPAGPPTAPGDLGATTPLPGQDQAAKTETYLVESVTAGLSPNGNRFYSVRGGRVKKHGATMWPEIAEELDAITGYDPEQLEVGVKWDVASFGIEATAEVPAGKKYPTKVVGLQKTA